MEDGYVCSFTGEEVIEGDAVLALTLAAGLGGGGALLVATTGAIGLTTGTADIDTGEIEAAFIGNSMGGGCRAGEIDVVGEELHAETEGGGGVKIGCKGGIGSNAGTSLGAPSLAAAAGLSSAPLICGSVVPLPTAFVSFSGKAPFVTAGC